MKKAPGRNEFDEEREVRRNYVCALMSPSQLIKRDWRWGLRDEKYEWCLIGPIDVRHSRYTHSFALQYTLGGGLRVRAGCRYYTLPQAWKHWGGKRGRGWGKLDRQQAVAIIRLLLLQAEAFDLPGVKKGTVFDATITKPRKSRK